MFKKILTFFIFIFLEVIVFASLVYHQNLHINSVLEDTLSSDNKEFKIIKKLFSENFDEKVYKEFRKIILLDSVQDIHDYVEYKKMIVNISSLVNNEERLSYLKKRELFDVIKYGQKDILLFDKENTAVSISLIPYYDIKNNLNYFIEFTNQAGIHDMKYRTKILFLVLSILILLLVAHAYYVYNIKAKLATKNEENARLLEAMDKYVLLTETDTHGFLTHVSTAFSEVSGYGEHELVGRPHSVIRHPDMPKEVFKNMWEDLTAGKVWKGEIKNIDKFGNTYWVDGIIIPKYDANKNLIGYISFRKDITDKKRLDELNSELKKVIEGNINKMEILDSSLVQQSKKALIGNLVDIIAHQWKQPLSIISLYAIDLSESVKHGEMNQSYADELSGKMQRQIAHLASTLNGFRTFFSPSNSYDKFSLFENLENILLLVEDELKNNQIDVKIDGDKNIELYGISNEFQHVFLNFIGNSRDAFIEKGIKDRKVMILFFKKDDAIEIDYFDNAGGIKENIIHKIFDLNFTTKPIGLGTGVGMYATKLIVEKLGGNIMVKNYNGGVNFKIKLPNKDRRAKDRSQNG